MPPQLTNVTSEPGRDATRVELPVAWAKNAIDNAAARLNASLATPLDALPETDGTASTRSVLSLLKLYWRAFSERRRRESLRNSLSCLDDRQLMDIGLTRGEIDYLNPQRAIDRLRDNAIQSSRGVI